MLSAVTRALLLLATARAAAPPVDQFVQQVSSACLESVSAPLVEVSAQLTALAAAGQTALPAAVQQLQQAQQEAAQRAIASQQEATVALRDGQKRLQTQLAALEKKLAAPASPRSPAPPRLSGPCPAGWSTGGDHCFLVSADAAAWLTAHGECARLDSRARLASVHADTVSFIESLPTVRLWIGLSHSSSASPWLWADGTPLDYTNWDRSRNQPDSGTTELCALIFDEAHRGWHDYPCEWKFQYLCQIRMK